MGCAADNLIQTGIRAGIEKGLIFKDGALEILHSGKMVELKHESGQSHDKPVLAMDVVSRLNMLNNPAEIVFGKSALRRQKQQSGKDKQLILLHGRSPSCLC